VQATIVVKDIVYPFPYPVGIGIPYLVSEQGVLKQIRRKKVVIRHNTNGYEAVAFVGKNFALVPNELVEEMTEKAVTAYNLSMLKKSKDRYENTLRIDLLSDRLAEVQEGDIVQFGVSIRNSIDGTSCLAVDLFSYRLTCRNGATVKDTNLSFAVKHIGNPQEIVKAFHRALAEVMERFDDLLKLYRRMANTALTEEHARRLLALKLPEMYYAHTGIRVRDDKVEVREGTTLWYAFNGITYVLTHRSRASPLARSYMSHRLHRVMQAIVSA
jgi:hypothetical protein